MKIGWQAPGGILGLGASLCDCQSIPIDPNINLRIMRNQGAWVIEVTHKLVDVQFINWQCFSNVKQPLVEVRLQCWRDVISTNTITISPSSLQLTLKHLDNSCLAILLGKVILPNNILNGPKTEREGFMLTKISRILLFIYIFHL